MLFITGWLTQKAHSLWVVISAESPFVMLVLLGALIVGVILIGISAKVKKKAHRAAREPGIQADIFRDLGIAVLISVIVTLGLELHVRTIMDTKKIEDVLHTILHYNVPTPVWGEVNKNILQSDRLRKNVSIDFDVEPDPSLPPSQAFLIIKYQYDLYWLKANSAQTDVKHVKDTDSDLAGFDHVVIADAGGNILKEYKCPNGEKRKPEFNELVPIEPGYDQKKEDFIPEKRITVTTERHEVIYLPGSYTLGMPFLMLGEADNPVKVSVKVPGFIEPSMETQWAGHQLVKVPNNPFAWTFTGVIVPGQFLELKLNQKTRPRLVTPASTLNF